MSARIAAATKSAAAPRVVLAVLCVAQFMLLLDVAVVNVALPPMQVELGIATADLQWVSTAYTLVFGGALLLAGRAGDLLGRRRLLVVGLLLFTAASLLCGLAQSGWQLFLARGLQGLGAAVVSPVAFSLLTATFPEGAERSAAIGVWGAVGAGGAVAGQVAGGALAQLLDW